MSILPIYNTVVLNPAGKRIFPVLGGGSARAVITHNPALEIRKVPIVFSPPVPTEVQDFPVGSSTEHGAILNMTG